MFELFGVESIVDKLVVIVVSVAASYLVRTHYSKNAESLAMSEKIVATILVIAAD